MTESGIPAEALEAFRAVFASAHRPDVAEPTAMTLATADGRGRPSSRTVLLKGFDAHGFVFYTNLGSRKADQLRENPWASLTFFWGPIERQVQIEGRVERVEDREADAYWATRERESRIGAWGSRQSQPLASREELLAQVARIDEKHQGLDVPRPAFWSGFRVVPHRIEFWRGMPHRLHDRVLFERGSDGAWTKTLLYP
jgi:pyridoxamine 5'-phosphate oxidase